MDKEQLESYFNAVREEELISRISSPFLFKYLEQEKRIKELETENDRFREAVAAIIGYTHRQETDADTWVHLTALRGFGADSFEEYWRGQDE